MLHPSFQSADESAHPKSHTLCREKFGTSVSTQAAVFSKTSRYYYLTQQTRHQNKKSCTPLERRIQHQALRTSVEALYPSRSHVHTPPSFSGRGRRNKRRRRLLSLTRSTVLRKSMKVDRASSKLPLTRSVEILHYFSCQ